MKYLDKAVATLASYLSANLQTYLTSTEVDCGLSAGTLEMPIVATAELPEDNRSPLLQVFDRGFDAPTSGQRHKLTHAHVTVLISWQSGVDLEIGAARIRQYVSAILDCWFADPSLGGGMGSIYTGGEYIPWGDDSSIRHNYAIAFDVFVTSA